MKATDGDVMCSATKQPMMRIPSADRNTEPGQSEIVAEIGGNDRSSSWYCMCTAASTWLCNDKTDQSDAPKTAGPCGSFSLFVLASAFQPSSPTLPSHM